jgi:hypothetical protein
MEEHRWRVFEKRVLRRTFGLKRDEMTGCWRHLHNEELHNLYSSQNINRMIKSRRMKWTGHVVRMGRSVSIILVTKLEERDHKEDLDVSGNLILRSSMVWYELD